MTQRNFQINSAAITDKGLSDKRPQNEDSYLELPDSGFFGVADGVGGAQAGDVASQMAMEILAEAFINLPEGGDAEERMKIAIEQANQAIFQMSNDLPQLSTMATTVVGLHIQGDIATIGHVGDSRLYRVDPQGNLYQETQDHSVVEEEVRAGRMTREQAENHPSRNVISRALGAEDTVEIDLKTTVFEPGTTFLVCSDGVTRHHSDEELRELLFLEQDTFAICQSIKDVCYERGAEDNLTAVVVKIEEKSADSGFSGTEDLEEETVASTRPAFANSGVFGDKNSDSTVDTLEIPDSQEVEPNVAPERLEKDQKISIESKLENENTLSILGDSETEGSVSGEHRDIKTYRVGDDGVTGTLRTILPWALLGLVCLVFAAYYFLAGSTQPVAPGTPKTTTTDITLADFEKRRLNLDTSPSQYIAANVNAESAIDFYLLGRAHFLDGKYDEAKKNMERARVQLSEGDSPLNKRVLENDIPMILAIISSAEAKKVFEAENTKGKTGTDGANSNAAVKK